MKHPKDLCGIRYGNLIVLHKSEQPKKWVCLCDCGTVLPVLRGSLTNDNTKSCGCGKIEATIRRSTKHNHAHMGNKSTEYRIWAGILTRCRNSKHHSYVWYGGRGINVCDRWIDFTKFLEDMGLRPSAKHSIHRIDNDGDYEASNCKWATAIEQANNSRKNVRITWNDLTKTAIEWARSFGWPERTIHKRLQRGWTMERTMTQKPKRQPCRR